MEPLISKVQENNHVRDLSVDCAKVLNLLNLCDSEMDITNNLWDSVDCLSFGPLHVICSLDDDDLLYLTHVDRLFFPDVIDITIPHFYD
jgi:hypothetical protein